MYSKVKICPLMSTAEKIVECTDDCAWYSETMPHKCAVNIIIEAIDNAADKIKDIAFNMPTE